MINLLLDPGTFLLVLVALALATPPVAVLVRRQRPDLVNGRQAIVLALVGPFALCYWPFHQFVLSRFGFDTVVSASIILVTAAAIGFLAGLWAGRGNG